MEVELNAYVYVEGEARRRVMDSVEGLISNAVGELEFTYSVELTGEGYLEVSGEGEDATVARNILTEEFGERVDEARVGELYTAHLESWSPDGFAVDCGVSLDVPVESLEELGKGSPSQIRQRYGLVQHLPLEVEATGDGEARLSDLQVDELWDWTRGSGRLNVNSTTRSEIRATLNRAGHADDVVTVERLGLLEQSVVCREETDPPGLLSSVGPYVHGEMLCVVD